MRQAVWRGCAVIAAFWPAVAEAHSPIKGLGTFYNYMLHPLLVPAHALLLVALALMLGQQGRESAGTAIFLFALSLVAGLAVSSAGIDASLGEPLLLAGSLVVGGTVSLGRRLPRIAVLALAAIAGLAIGLDSAAETSGTRDTVLAYAGLTTGILYLATVVCGLTVGLLEHWQRVAVRIAGSWIVAASVMVLALMLTAPADQDSAALPASEEARQC
jgi:urease accessory protein